ncbi:glutamine ABC transporter ATP-binding protein GlnQ, partial [Rhizobium ruizarguesonis]
LIRCINHLETYAKGEIRVGGILLGNQAKNIDAIRREVGMVFPQFNLFPHLPVLQNCMLAPMKAIGVGQAEAEERARGLLERV